MYKVMFSVGEASGDLHGASVARALQTLCPGIRLVGMGGKAMAEAGVDLCYDIKDLGIIGLVEVIRNLRKLFRLKKMLGEFMDREKPDVLVIIDYPGFNMKLAALAKSKGIPVVSYISPSAWAWGRGRAKEMASLADRVAAIFPFEADVYRAAGAKVTFVGHPLLDIVKPSLTKEEAYRYFSMTPGDKVVLLLPGSREQEIRGLLPDMMETAERLAKTDSSYRFFLPLASTISREMIEEIISRYPVRVQITGDHTYDLMGIAGAGIAASGTVTLEAALMGLPTVIIYRVAALTYAIGKWLVKIPHIGLPNIIAGRKMLPEYLQHEIQPDQLAADIKKILDQPEYGYQLRADMKLVREKLGHPGAVERVGKVILEIAGGKPVTAEDEVLSQTMEE